jgi:hypothetical protein
LSEIFLTGRGLQTSRSVIFFRNAVNATNNNTWKHARSSAARFIAKPPTVGEIDLYLAGRNDQPTIETMVLMGLRAHRLCLSFAVALGNT